MKDKEPELSRRDFLKVALVGLLAACVKGEKTPTFIPTSPDGQTLTPVPSDISPSAIPAEASATPEIAWARPSVTIEQAKSVVPSISVSLDENGYLVGLEGKDETLRTDVRNRCLALLSAKEQNFGLTEGEMADFKVTREDFTGGRVYFSQDAASGHWILYFRLANGDIMHQVASYAGGGAQWADYPVAYNTLSTGVTGDYLPLAVPSPEVGVVWFASPDGKVIIPQFVASPKTLTDGEQVFTQALRYGFAYEPITWFEISGLEALSFSTPTPEATVQQSYAEKLKSESVIETVEVNYQGVPIKVNVLSHNSIKGNKYSHTEYVYPDRTIDGYDQKIAQACLQGLAQTLDKNSDSLVYLLKQDPTTGIPVFATDLTKSGYNPEVKTFYPINQATGQANEINIVFMNVPSKDFPGAPVRAITGAYLGRGIDENGNLYIMRNNYPDVAIYAGAGLDGIDKVTTNIVAIGLESLSWKGGQTDTGHIRPIVEGKTKIIQLFRSDGFIFKAFPPIK